MSTSPPTLSPLEIALPGEHVSGFPLLCAITVRCSRPGAELAIPHVDVLDDGGVIGLTLEDAAGNVLMSRTRAGAVDEDRVVLATLHAGEARRMLVDLSAVFTREPPPGNHRLRVSYAAPVGTTTSALHDLTFRPPTSAETAMLDTLNPARGPSTTWGRWIVEAHTTTAVAAPNVARFLAQPPLRLLWLLRSIVGGDPPDVWERTAIEHLGRGDEGDDAWLVPEREALWAEVLALRSDPGLAQQLAHVRGTYPSLEWWMRAIEQGTSNLSVLRSAFAGMLAG